MKVKINMRTVLRVSCIIGIAVLTVFGLNACILNLINPDQRTSEERYASAFKNNWNIILPGNLLEFSKSEKGIDGIRYAVLKLEKEPEDFIADFSREKNEAFENTVNIDLFAAEFGVSVNFLPDWEAAYYWKHTGNGDGGATRVYWDNLYMIYFPDSLRLKICQHFM